nr:hypothetical protein [Staphylococcus haemolyticus]
MCSSDLIAKSNGVETINQVQPTVVKKDEAKTAIDNVAQARSEERRCRERV